MLLWIKICHSRHFCCWWTEICVVNMGQSCMKLVSQLLLCWWSISVPYWNMCIWDNGTFLFDSAKLIGELRTFQNEYIKLWNVIMGQNNIGSHQKNVWLKYNITWWDMVTGKIVPYMGHFEQFFRRYKWDIFHLLMDVQALERHLCP